MPGMDNICNEKVATKAEDVVHVYDPASLPNFLPLYYKFLFPYKPYFSWLSYGGGACILFLRVVIFCIGCG